MNSRNFYNNENPLKGAATMAATGYPGTMPDIALQKVIIEAATHKNKQQKQALKHYKKINTRAAAAIERKASPPESAFLSAAFFVQFKESGISSREKGVLPRAGRI